MIMGAPPVCQYNPTGTTPAPGPAALVRRTTGRVMRGRAF